MGEYFHSYGWTFYILAYTSSICAGVYVMVFFIRGAFCLNSDDEAQMIDRVHTVMDALLKKNAIRRSHIKSIFFTQTSDIQLVNVASCLRKRQGYEHIALFTSQEATVRGMLRKTIRIMVVGEKFFHFRKNYPVYMFGAEQLRTDIFT